MATSISASATLLQLVLDPIAADDTITIPAGYGIASAFLRNSTANAMTGDGLRIGTTNGGVDVIAALPVAASALMKIPDAAWVKAAFSKTVATILYLQAIAGWNSASLNISMSLERLP